MFPGEISLNAYQREQNAAEKQGQERHRRKRRKRKEVIIMSIDWEYLLDAEGDELQDAYDQAVEEASEMLDWGDDY